MASHQEDTYPTIEDESFTPLTPEEASKIKDYFNDPLLEENITKIYECHGDPSGNMIYVGGQTNYGEFCVYIKYKNEPETTKILRCNTMIDYVQQLAELDQQLFRS